MSPSDTGKKTRADIVRARRQMEKMPKKPVPRQTVRPETKRDSQSRVISRKTSNMDAGRKYYGKTTNRRSVYMPLQTPGAELKLPSLPNLTLGWRIASGILALAMLIFAVGMREMEIFQVSKVNLIGAERNNADEVLSRLDLKGEAIVELIPEEIENDLLKQFHDIKSVSVKLGMPSSVSVTVKEREPVVLWMRGEVSSFWIDKEGFMFPVRGEASTLVPVQSTADPPRPINAIADAQAQLELLLNEYDTSTSTPDVNPDFVQAILSLRDVVPAETTMVYEPSYGLGWEDPRGWKVYFGVGTEDIALKLAEYEVIVNTLQEQGIQPALISLEFLHAPYYRLEH